MEIIVIAHNIRSTYNVGSIFRTADGFGVNKMYLSGYTPAPEFDNDPRPPHVRKKVTQSIHKTALGAEESVSFEYVEDIEELIRKLKNQGYVVGALEQTPDSIELSSYKTPEKMVLILGEEVNGVEDKILNLCDVSLEIPMRGKKESFNVSVATGIALYSLIS